jgi:Icc-related predicted phosphoesterase
MIVYAASDLHGHLPDVPAGADLLLLAGDICPDFRPARDNHWDMVDKGGLKQFSWLKSHFKTWAKMHGVPIVMIWGNHDFVGENTGFAREFQRLRCAKLLVDEAYDYSEKVTDRPLSIYGTPWVPGLPYWAFYGDDRKLALRAEAIPEGLDVLMTHGPPAYAGDYIPTSEKQRNKYGNFGGQHVGDPTLNERILSMERPPKVVICGHIHEDRGAHEVAGVPVYNVAAVDAEYRLHSQPWTRLYELEV